jgi:hypothetical protein
MRSAKEESTRAMHMQPSGEPEETEEEMHMQPSGEPEETEEESTPEIMHCCQTTLHTHPLHIQQLMTQESPERISELTAHIEELLQAYQQCRVSAEQKKEEAATLANQLNPGLDKSRQLLTKFAATTGNVVRGIQHLIMKTQKEINGLRVSGKAKGKVADDKKKEQELQKRIAQVQDDRTTKSTPLIAVMMKDINKMEKANRAYKAAAAEAIKCEDSITVLLKTDRTDLDAALKSQQTLQAQGKMQQEGSNGNEGSNGKSDGTYNAAVETHAHETSGSPLPTCTCAGMHNSNCVGAYCVGPDETANKWCYVIDNSGCKDELTSSMAGIDRSIKISHQACTVIEEEGRTDEQEQSGDSSSSE